MTEQKVIAKRETGRLPQYLDPFDYLDSIFFRPVLPVDWKKFGWGEMKTVPAIEMVEKDNKYVVKAELPGIKEDDIEITVKDGYMTVKGEKKYENDVKEEDYYYRETSYGTFHRTLSLPADVVESKIEANYDDGILEIVLPKTTGVKPKKVAVSRKKKEKITKE